MIKLGFTIQFAIWISSCLAQGDAVVVNSQIKKFFEFSSERDLDNFNVLTSGDSIYFSYAELVYQPGDILRVQKANWIATNGKSTSAAPLPNPFGVRRIGSKIYYYGLGKSGEIEVLNVWVEEVGSGFLPGPTVLTVGGMVVGGFFNEKDFFLAVFDRQKKSLGILHLRGVKVIERKEYPIPDELSKHFSDPNNYASITNQSGMNSFRGTPKIKIYLYDNSFFVSVDLPGSSKKGPRTELLTLNESGVGRKTITEPTEAMFGSFYLDGMIFRFTTERKQVHVSVFDTKTEKELVRQSILKEVADFPVYNRNESQGVLNTDYTFKMMLREAEDARPSMVVNRCESGYRLQCGIYFVVKTGTIIPSTSSAIGFWVLPAALDPFPTGRTQYFYYSFDPLTKKLALVPSGTCPVRSLIDQFEIDNFRNSPVNLNIYAEHDQGMIALYRSRKTKSVSLVLFKE